jgi:5'-3' exonuclease
MLLHAQIVFMPNQNDSKDQIRQQMLARNDPASLEPVRKPELARKPYQFLMIPVLREYITHEFAPERALPFAYDPERVIDDFGECWLPCDLVLTQHKPKMSGFAYF